MTKLILTMLLSAFLGLLSFYILIEYRGIDSGFYVALLLCLMAAICAFSALSQAVEYFATRKASDNPEALFEQIAEALATYELDEPHSIDDPVGDEKITWADIAYMMQLPHEHNQAVTCRRCLADDWIYKANYIAERLAIRGKK